MVHEDLHEEVTFRWDIKEEKPAIQLGEESAGPGEILRCLRNWKTSVVEHVGEGDSGTSSLWITQDLLGQGKENTERS